MNKTRNLLSIVVPIYNEEKIINSTFASLKSIADKWKYNYEI